MYCLRQCLMCLISLSGMNKSYIHVGVMDIDLAVLEEKPIVINDSGSNELKACYKAWER